MRRGRVTSQLKIKSRTKWTVLNSFYALAILGLIFQPFYTPFYDHALADSTPAISSVSPNTGLPAGGESVTINGSGFELQEKATKVSAGGFSSCAVVYESAYCWGRNDYGQLGNDSTADSSVPVAVDTSGVLSGKTVTDISAGESFACAVASGEAYCWGRNDAGQLGIGSTTNSSVPVAVNTSGVLSGKTVTDVSASNSMACAVASGEAYCWGGNSFGQLGIGSTTDSSAPVAVSTSGVLGGKTVTDISAGGSFACAVASGEAYCWGGNSFGQLGIGSTTDSSAPVAVNTSGVLSGKTVTAISASGSPVYFAGSPLGTIGTACVIADEQIYCWGSNDAGQLGIGSTTDSSAPVAVNTSGVLSGKTVTDISVAVRPYSLISTKGTVCAIADSNGYCWGDNSNGQLGTGSTTNSSVPMAVTSGGSLSSIDAGRHVSSTYSISNTCAISVSQDLLCWGANNHGQVGDNTTSSRIEPIAVNQSAWSGVIPRSPTVTLGGYSATNVTYVSSTELTATTPMHAPGLVDMTVTNPDGEAATATNAYTYVSTAPVIDSISPDNGVLTDNTNVTITGSNFKMGRVNEVSTGIEGTTCALAANHDVYCWGSNWDGQLGTGIEGDSNVPVKIKMDGALANKTVTDIDSGLAYSCAAASGKPYCWGNNDAGKLGNNSTTMSPVPVAVDTSGVLAGKTVTKVAAGYHHSCAIADGEAYCWGDNTYGGLGNNTTTDSSVPVAVDTSGVLAGKTVTDISVGEYFTCAVADGLPYCWGYGEYNRLGRGSSDANTSVPIANQLASGSWTGKTVTDISVGESHGCLVANSVAYCWGNNWAGQVGDNSTTTSHRSVPVYAAGQLNDKTVTDIATGPYQTCAIAGVEQYCWGENPFGQLGDGTTIDRHAPTAVDTSGVFGQKIVTGLGGISRYNSCSIASDAVYCWGDGSDGELGDDSYNSSLTPVATVMSSFSSAPPEVYFGTTLANNITHVSDTQLTVSTPPAATPGYVDVTVANHDSQDDTVVNGYEYTATAPDSPTGLATTPGENSTILNWNAPSYNGGSPVTDYKIEYSPNGGSDWSVFSHSPSTSTNIAVTGLSIGTTYTFRVSAVNSVGTSDPSSTATGTPIYITLENDSNISIDILPQGSTTVSSNKHTLTVDTNSPGGFKITVEMFSATRNLTNNSYTISPSSGTLGSPTSLLVNTWGYRVDGSGGFGNGPTVAETNVDSSGYTWAGVPANGSPQIIKSSSIPQTNDKTTVWYGLNASKTKASGSYSGTILYTAISG